MQLCLVIPEVDPMIWVLARLLDVRDVKCTDHTYLMMRTSMAQWLQHLAFPYTEWQVKPLPKKATDKIGMGAGLWGQMI
jgi:hypothetical protein